jgi:NTE family protein
VNAVPVGRAVAHGAREVYVLHAGRLERPVRPPTRPWEVAAVALEVARRHRYSRDVADLPARVAVHLLPTGDAPGFTAVRYRRTGSVARRIEAARAATAGYLADRSSGERQG